uniref:Uncharacterized protein n=1 Tax=Anguilla anguilla TaxID=7936 RepID=A0A0E9PYA3_ANGAN
MGSILSTQDITWLNLFLYCLNYVFGFVCR